jgi:uncharacterized protein YeaO (DUF488 family)
MFPEDHLQTRRMIVDRLAPHGAVQHRKRLAGFHPRISPAPWPVRESAAQFEHQNDWFLERASFIMPIQGMAAKFLQTMMDFVSGQDGFHFGEVANRSRVQPQ